jgi:Limiting CO2-inducible proteins B/C beta carbonyic anhydrases
MHHPLFQQALDAHFPGALPLSDYMVRTSESLAPFGFEDANTLGLLSTCRDEIASPLARAVMKHWGKTFDCRGLGGFPMLGRSGIRTAIHHAPIVEGQRRFVYFAMPHIAISDQGEIGTVYREEMQKASSACGSLIAVRDELLAGKVNILTDLDDIEQSTVRQKLLSDIAYGQIPDLVEVTTRTCQIIEADIERLLHGICGNSTEFRYAVMTGILIHGPAETEWVHPRGLRVVAADPSDG